MITRILTDRHRQNKGIDIVLIIIGVLFTLLTLFLCFYKLSDFNIHKWDEARHGVNAYEMLRNDNYIVSTYRNQPDYWNLKPPLSYWCIALSFRIFGYSIFSLRLYAAVSIFFLCLLLSMYFLKKRGILASVISLALFNVCSTFFYFHYRSGDADALYTFLFSVAMIAMLELENYPRLIYICGFVFSLALLTKSYHAMVIMVIGALYLLLTGIWKEYSWKQLLIFIVCALGPIAAWVIARYSADGSKFFEEMLVRDVLRRSTEVVEGHGGGAFYYVKELYQMVSLWPSYLLCGVWILLELKAEGKRIIKNPVLLGVMLWIFVPIVLFSMVSSKLSWYIWVSIPGILFGAVCGANKLIDRISEQKKGGQIAFIITGVSLAVLFVIPFGNVQIMSDYRLEGTQDAIMTSFSRGDQYYRCNFYIKSADGTDKWTQDDVLAVELADDFYPQDGGIDEFIKDDEPCLIILNDIEGSQIEEIEGVNMIADSNGSTIYYKEN